MGSSTRNGRNRRYAEACDLANGLPLTIRERTSPYGHLTARFAPKPTSASTLANDEVGTIPVVRVVAIPAGRALGTKFEKCSASKIVVPDRETP
jgi:hypothetical protein